jgi:hypothetical protein
MFLSRLLLASVKIDGFSYQPKHPRRGDVLVSIDVAKVEASYSQDREFYVGPGGSGSAIGNRYDRFIQWLEDNPNTPIDPSLIGLGPSKDIRFGDGRHRWAVLRDSGVKNIAVIVPDYDLGNFEKLYGAVRL